MLKYLTSGNNVEFASAALEVYGYSKFTWKFGRAVIDDLRTGVNALHFETFVVEDAENQGGPGTKDQDSAAWLV